MISNEKATGTKNWGWKIAAAAFALALAGCAEVDDSIGSHLAQPPAGAPKQKPTEAGDIAIVGQEVSHSIVELPAVSGASVPPLVQFTGVTSIVDKPIDTEPYTELLRDRLLLLTREKLRFVEHTLPPYVPPSKAKKMKQPVQNTTDADFLILAELRGRAEDDYYKIQIEFVDAHTKEILYNQLFRIRKEADQGGEQTSSPSLESTAPNTPPPPLSGNASL